MALICPRCKCSNFSDAKQCYRCSAPLDAQTNAEGLRSDGWRRDTASFQDAWQQASPATWSPDDQPAGAKRTSLADAFVQDRRAWLGERNWRGESNALKLGVLILFFASGALTKCSGKDVQLGCVTIKHEKKAPRGWPP